MFKISRWLEALVVSVLVAVVVLDDIFWQELELRSHELGFFHWSVEVKVF